MKERNSDQRLQSGDEGFDAFINIEVKNALGEKGRAIHERIVELFTGMDIADVRSKTMHEIHMQDDGLEDKLMEASVLMPRGCKTTFTHQLHIDNRFLERNKKNWQKMKAAQAPVENDEDYRTCRCRHAGMNALINGPVKSRLQPKDFNHCIAFLLEADIATAISKGARKMSDLQKENVARAYDLLPYNTKRQFCKVACFDQDVVGKWVQRFVYGNES